jgi:hypothetical protein
MVRADKAVEALAKIAMAASPDRHAAADLLLHRGSRRTKSSQPG